MIKIQDLEICLSLFYNIIAVFIPGQIVFLSVLEQSFSISIQILFQVRKR